MELLVTLETSASELGVMGIYLPYFLKVDLQLRFLSQEK